MKSFLGILTVLYCICVFYLLLRMDDSASRDKKDVTSVKCTPRVPKTTLKPKIIKPAPVVVQPKQYGPGNYIHLITMSGFVISFIFVELCNGMVTLFIATGVTPYAVTCFNVISDLN